MRFEIRPRKEVFAGVTPGWILGVFFFGLAILAAYCLNRFTDFVFSPCLFRNVTSLPCPLCGGTRAAFSLATGHPWMALRWNPLATIGLVCGVTWFSIWMISGRQFRLGARSVTVLAGILILLLVNWLYVLQNLRDLERENARPDHGGRGGIFLFQR